MRDGTKGRAVDPISRSRDSALCGCARSWWEGKNLEGAPFPGEPPLFRRCDLRVVVRANSPNPVSWALIPDDIKPRKEQFRTETVCLPGTQPIMA